MEKVNIIVATYNGEKYLKEQLDSIIKNTYSNWVITICDDGSTDKTMDIAKDYQEQFKEKIRIHRNESNMGVAMNFLEAAKNSTEDYIMFCDQDDYWLPEKIEHTLLAMKGAEEKDQGIPIAVFTDAKIVDSKLNEVAPSFFQSNNLDMNRVDLPHLLMENKLQGCTIMINREVKDKLAVLPKYLKMHDWWVGLICASFGKIVYLDEQTMLYRQHNNNVIGNQDFILYILRRVRNLRRQKAALISLQKQAHYFYKIYKDQLGDPNKKIVYQFANLRKKNWVKRRVLALRYGYLKTGIIRNMGIMLLL